MWTISSSPLFSQEFQKGFEGLLFGRVKIDTLLTAPTDPAPRPDERHLAKECWLEREFIVARHVPAGVNALNVKVEGLCAHATRIARPSDGRPIRILNQ